MPGPVSSTVTTTVRSSPGSFSTRIAIPASGPPNLTAFPTRFEKISGSRSSARTSTEVSTNNATFASGIRSIPARITLLMGIGLRSGGSW